MSQAEQEATAERWRGHIIWFDPKKSYGFIRPAADRGRSRDIFLHVTDAQASGIPTPAQGDELEFEVVQEAKGLRAINLRLLKRAGAGA